MTVIKRIDRQPFVEPSYHYIIEDLVALESGVVVVKFQVLAKNPDFPLCTAEIHYRPVAEKTTPQEVKETVENCIRTELKDRLTMLSDLKFRVYPCE